MSGWLRAARNPHCGVPFEIFRSTMERVRHVFMALPARKGLLSACNKVLGMEPRFVFLSRNKDLRSAVADCRAFLRDSFGRPTPCRELVPAWPSFVGAKDASDHDVGSCLGKQQRVGRLSSACSGQRTALSSRYRAF